MISYRFRNLKRQHDKEWVLAKRDIENCGLWSMCWYPLIIKLYAAFDVNIRNFRYAMCNVKKEVQSSNRIIVTKQYVVASWEECFENCRKKIK